MSEIQISLGPYRWFSLACVAGAAAGAIACMHFQQYAPLLFCIPFGLTVLYLGLIFGTYAINDQSLTYVSRLGTWRISWSEISAAQTSPAGTLLLMGDNKHFSLAAPSFWPGSCRVQAFRFICEQLSLHQIVPSPNRLVDYKWMKNVRVRQE